MALLESETLCDYAEADRKPGMKLKSSQSNRSLATMKKKKEAGLKNRGRKKKTESEERGRKLITQKADILLRKEETCRVGPTQASAVIWAIRKENDRKRVKLEKKTDGCLLTSRLLSIPFYLLFSVPAACNQTALHTTNNKSFLNLDGEEAVRSCQRARQIELQLFRLD